MKAISVAPAGDCVRQATTDRAGKYLLVTVRVGCYNALMVDRATFVRYVHEAFARLDDPPYLTTHPLGSLLFGADQPASAETLRRALLSAVAQLRPPEGTPHDSASWRRWQALTLRHVDGLNSRQIARKLQVSLRQAQRDHLAGVDAVSSILWARRQPQRPATLGLTPATGAVAPKVADLAHQEDLETELARAATLSPAGATSLAEALESAVATLRGVLAERQAHLEVSFPDDLRPVAVHQAALRQILLCVLASALHSRHEPRISISMATGAESAEIIFTVRGKIPPHQTRQSGLDEAETLVDTARRFAELQGGALEIVDETNRSRRLALVLPATPLRTILVVDDNPDVAELFRAYLAGTQYQPVQARTAPTALRLARELRPDVITLDVLMPTQDGWQILQQLRADPATRDVPIVVCSIVPEQPLATSLGANSFLAKPVTPEALLAALERCLESRPAVMRPGSRADTPSARPPLGRSLD